MHVPSTIGTNLAANTGAIIIAITPSLNAGGSATTNIAAEDRDRTVDVGNNVDTIIFNIGIRTPTVSGNLMYAVMKQERQQAVPVIGTPPVPSDAGVNGVGLQQAVRMEAPGRCYKYGIVPYTAETSRAFSLKMNLRKFRIGKIRPGDYVYLHLFNKGTGTCTVDVEMRYKSWT